ncbi:hypothetical protein ACVIGB_008512 [Bradyrhizobium sp. USDA 4341]
MGAPFALEFGAESPFVTDFADHMNLSALVAMNVIPKIVESLSETVGDLQEAERLDWSVQCRLFH